MVCPIPKTGTDQTISLEKQREKEEVAARRFALAAPSEPFPLPMSHPQMKCKVTI
jgi:hypothetical protein